MRVLAHLLSPLILHLSAARQALAFARFFLFPAFRRTFLAPPQAPVAAPGQILFPVEFKTPRNIRIYFTGVPRAAGRIEEEEEEEEEAARFYSGSDEARKRNKEKMYTRETREAAQTRTQGEERRRAREGRREER